MTKIETAQSALDTAQSALDAALLAGTDTRDARQAVSEAQAKLNRLLAAEANADAPDPAIEQAIESDARALLSDAVTAINLAVEQATTFDRPSVTLSAGVAETVIRDRHKAAQAADTRRAHADKLTELQGRMRALEQRRADIIAERSSGAKDDEKQGAELALIQADQDGLRQLIARYQADVPAVASATPAESQWAAHLASAQGAALLTVANDLQARLIDVAERLVTLSGGRMDNRLRPDPRWLAIVPRGVW